jgi:DNA-binding transcriptional LysR family regulator
MLNRLEMLRIFCTAAEARNFKEAAQQLVSRHRWLPVPFRRWKISWASYCFTAIRASAGLPARVSVWRSWPGKGWRGGLHIPARRKQYAQQVEGTVRLTAPEAIGQASLVHSLARLRQHYPDLHFELHLEDDETNVVDEQIDIGIRHGLIRDSRFVARQVAEVHFFMVAAPGLLAQCGVPQTLEALQQQPVVGTIDQRTGKPWPWFFAMPRSGRRVIWRLVATAPKRSVLRYWLAWVLPSCPALLPFHTCRAGR